jgi:hypothetical protein
VILLFLGALSASTSSALANSPAYCRGLGSSKPLTQLSLVMAGLGNGRVDRSQRSVLRDASGVLGRAAARAAAGRAEREFRVTSSTLARWARRTHLTRRDLVEGGTQFRELADGASSTCNLPRLKARFVAGKAENRPGGANRGPLSAPSSRVGHISSGTDLTLCSSKPDRTSIPSNFVVDACFDDRTLYLKNRTPLVQYVSPSGAVSSPSRVQGIPGEAASLLVAYLYPDARVLPPGYEVAMSVTASAGAISVSPAETRILDIYGITRVLTGYIPLKASLFFAAGSMVNALVDEVDAARNCLNGANIFKKVGCATIFGATASGSIAKFIATAGIDGLREAPAAIVRGLWGLLQEGMYIGDVAGAVFAPGSTSLAIKPAGSSAPPGSSPISSPPTGTAASPPSSVPPTPAPPAPQVWLEQETPNHPVNTFTNYHNASGMGSPIAAGAWVQVSCKVYDPTIQSVNPDGYWYRIASAPWNNVYYSPANTFMNGDPYGGPYTHNTDFAVPNC